MLDEKRPGSKLSDDEHRAQMLSWWMLSKAYACQLDARGVLGLVAKGLIEVGGSDTAEAECFRRLQRRPLLPVSIATQRPKGLVPASPHVYANELDTTAALESDSSSDDDAAQNEGFDNALRARLVATAARQAALGTAAVRSVSAFRRHRGLPPGPSLARRLVVLQTETGGSAGVALALFASIGTSVAAAMTETVSRHYRENSDSVWLRPAALKCLAQAEELAKCVVAVEDAFKIAQESSHGLRQVSIGDHSFENMLAHNCTRY